MPVAYRNTPNATSPDTSASNFLHNFKGFGLKFTLLGVGSGKGRISTVAGGYKPCHNAEAIIAGAGYDPEADTENTPHSVFCAHGAGFNVK